MQKLQFISFIGGLMVAVIFFIYTLSFSSNWAIGQNLGDFYLQAQEANKVIFQTALWTLIFAFFNIVLNSHKNKRLFTLNYILASLTSLFFVVSAFQTITYVIPLKVSYLELNQDVLTIIVAINYGSISTNVFDMGIIFSSIMCLFSILIMTTCVLKFRKQLLRAKTKKLHKMETLV